jgi:hypothetical protein
MYPLQMAETFSKLLANSRKAVSLCAAVDQQPVKYLKQTKL